MRALNPRSPAAAAEPVVRKVVTEANANGWRPVLVYDDEGGENVNTVEQAMESLFALDEATVRFLGPNRETADIAFVLSNGRECIHDWTGDRAFDAIVRKTINYFEL